MTIEIEPVARPSARVGRPTKAAAAERDERLLDIATQMFLEQGFEATSMDGLAEAAAVGKATLYARYADKAALFADVLRRRILQWYAPLEEEFVAAPAGADLEATLNRIAARLVDKSRAPGSIALGRILAAQGPRFPDLARLAMKEGYGRQLRLIETILSRFADDERYDLADLPMAADLFLSIVLGRTTRLAIYGITIDPMLAAKRTEAAVRVFIRGITRTTRR